MFCFFCSRGIVEPTHGMREEVHTCRFTQPFPRNFPFISILVLGLAFGIWSLFVYILNYPVVAAKWWIQIMAVLLLWYVNNFYKFYPLGRTTKYHELLCQEPGRAQIKKHVPKTRRLMSIYLYISKEYKPGAPGGFCHYGNEWRKSLSNASQLSYL